MCFYCLVVDIVPKTRQHMSCGEEFFAVAFLRFPDLAVVHVEGQATSIAPIFHSEVHAIRTFYEKGGGARPHPSELIVVSSHEPCCMCLSSLVWAGFTKLYYLCSYRYVIIFPISFATSRSKCGQLIETGYLMSLYQSYKRARFPRGYRYNAGPVASRFVLQTKFIHFNCMHSWTDWHARRK